MRGRGEENRAWRLKGAGWRKSMRKAGWARGRCQAAAASWHRRRRVVPTHLQDTASPFDQLNVVVTRDPAPLW